MKQRRLPILALACIITSTSACQALYDALTVPNVICGSRTFNLTGSLQDTPLDENHQPLSDAPSCLTVTGTSRDLSDYVSVWEADFEGQVEVESQSQLERLDAVMDAIEAGGGSMSPADDIQLYQETVQAVIDQMNAECVGALTTDYILCAQASAEEICQKRVVRPAEARYLDLDMGPSYERLPYFVSGSYGQGGDGWCFQEETDGDTDTDPGDGDGDGDGDGGASATLGGDETSGADSTGSGVAPPFGDLDELVHCNRAHTWCSYDPALVDDVVASIDQFARDGADLKLLVATDLAYPGVRLVGLDRDEPSTELAAAFGFEDGDLIRTIDGTKPTSEAIVIEVAKDLIQSGAATVEYERDGRLREVRIEPR